ncbi:MAG TPA: hypothetical protein VMU50_20400 [Polyangia bacterium]|nr:hypothetical protein [Polyangia bacterium]
MSEDGPASADQTRAARACRMKRFVPRMAAAGALGLALIAFASGGCQVAETMADRTALLVVVSSNVSDGLYDAVRVRAAVGGHSSVWPDPSQASPRRPPISVELVPDGASAGPIDVTAQLMKSTGDVVMEEKANGLRFVPGEQLQLTLALDSACLRISCPRDTMTCHLGVCRDADQPAPDQLFAIAEGDDPPATRGRADAGRAPGDLDARGGADRPAGGDVSGDGDDGGAGRGDDGGGTDRPPAGGPCADDTVCPAGLFCAGGHCAQSPPPEVTPTTFDLNCAMPYVPLCAPVVDEPFTAARRVAAFVNYRASPNLGLAITVAAWLDKDSAHAVQSRTLQPGDSTGPLAVGVAGPGPHTIHLQATGARALSEWKGAVEISTTWAR